MKNVNLSWNKPGNTNGITEIQVFRKSGDHTNESNMASFRDGAEKLASLSVDSNGYTDTEVPEGTFTYGVFSYNFKGFGPGDLTDSVVAVEEDNSNASSDDSLVIFATTWIGAPLSRGASIGLGEDTSRTFSLRNRILNTPNRYIGIGAADASPSEFIPSPPLPFIESILVKPNTRLLIPGGAQDPRRDIEVIGPKIIWDDYLGSEFSPSYNLLTDPSYYGLYGDLAFDMFDENGQIKESSLIRIDIYGSYLVNDSSMRYEIEYLG